MSAHDPPVLDSEHLNLVCGGDPVFEREILGDFLGQAEPQLAALAAAVEAGDTERTRFLAHALVGSGRSIGAAAFGEACRALETLARDGSIAQAPSCLERVQAEWRRLLERLRARTGRSAA